MIKWCLVRDGEVIEGPKRLPFVWRGEKLRDLTIVQRRALGWLPADVEEGMNLSAPEILIDRVNYTLAPSALDAYKEFAKDRVKQRFEFIVMKDLYTSHPQWDTARAIITDINNATTIQEIKDALP